MQRKAAHTWAQPGIFHIAKYGFNYRMIVKGTADISSHIVTTTFENLIEMVMELLYKPSRIVLLY